ncbi:MAG: hypothetical protein J6K32_04595 [Clostridia bacterium]|nr:hypothetical protein [Clostridia bacterium]
MARRMTDEEIERGVLEAYETVDAFARQTMAEYICDLREANDPDLEIREATIRELLRKLAVHHIELFDGELEAMMQERRAQRNGH